METIFLALSGIIVMAGVLYWFWSHIQLTQKKVQLLENAVFELRSMLTNSSQKGPPSGGAAGPAAVDAVAPTPVYNDLADDDWNVDDTDAAAVPTTSTPLEQVMQQDNRSTESQMDTTSGVHIERESYVAPSPPPVSPESNPDLMPGGRILHVAETEPQTEEQFRTLFERNVTVTTGGGGAATSAISTEPLESMSVKELRRLAEQRGIAHVGEMRKKEILAALRNQISSQQQEREVTVEMSDEQVSADAQATEVTVEEMMNDVSEADAVLE